MRDNVQARPTLHLLKGLDEGWTDSCQRRHIVEERWKELHPLARLDHPALAKAVGQFGSDPSDDINKGTISCSGDLHLLKVRAGQWRAGVWTDPKTGVRWVVAAGLAKGGHGDADDFYEQLKAMPGPALQALLPTRQDHTLLRRETAAAIMVEWRLDLQRLVIELLDQAMTQGSSDRKSVAHPTTGAPMAKVRVTWSAHHEPDYDFEEVVVELFDVAQPNSNLTDMMRIQILTAIAPPSQDWDVAGGIYSAFEEHGHTQQQLTALCQACDEDRVIEPQMGQLTHYTHTGDITTKTVNGEALRAICGKYFVPMQDPNRFPACPECGEIMDQIRKHTNFD